MITSDWMLQKFGKPDIENPKTWFLMLPDPRVGFLELEASGTGNVLRAVSIEDTPSIPIAVDVDAESLKSILTGCGHAGFQNS